MAQDSAMQIKHKWHSALGGHIENETWKKKNKKAQPNGKLSTDIFLSPTRLISPELTGACWRKCGGQSAQYLHVFLVTFQVDELLDRSFSFCSGESPANES